MTYSSEKEIFEKAAVILRDFKTNPS